MKKTITQWYLFNNLFYGGTLSHNASGDSPVLRAYDNLFDKAKILNSGAIFTHGNNGYVGSITHLQGSSSGGDKDIAWPAGYEDGPLGRYYYKTSGNLTR